MDKYMIFMINIKNNVVLLQPFKIQNLNWILHEII